MRHLLRFSLLFFFFALIFGYRSAVYAQSSEKIDLYDVNISINIDGTMDVTETILYNFGPQEKRGIFRVIPFVKTNEDGKDYKMDINVLSVKNSNGEAYRYEVNKMGKDIEIKIGDPNVYITGKHTYVINYRVGGALTYFSNHDELYWNVTGNDWEIPIDAVTARVTLPNEVSTDSLSGVCYTGVIGSTARNCTVNVQDKTLYLQTEMLSSREGITITLMFENGVVTELEPERYYPIHPVLLVLLIVLGFLYFLILPLYLLMLLFKDIRFVKRNANVVTAWFDPPKNEDFSWFTPEETAFLVDNTSKTEHITAKLVWLAQQGYLKINVDEKNKVSFEITDKPRQDLNSRDESLLKSLQKAGSENAGSLKKAIFGQTDEEKQIIELSEIKKSTQFGAEITKFKADIQKHLDGKGLYEKKLLRNTGVVVFFAMIGLVTLNIFLAGVMYLINKHYKGFTAKGIEKFAEARSLKNFLVSQDEKLDFQAEKQMFFEKLLPYATAFGVEDIWIKRFEGLNIRMPDWYSSSSGYYAFDSVTRGINSSVTGAVKTSTRSSSGFSSGGSGGSSGGGGGGGGGGSW